MEETKRETVATSEVEPDNKKKKAVKILKLSGFILLCVILAVLTLNSLLCIFMDHYYPTFGEYRLFAIVSDSMEPEIPTGNMIVSKVPKSEDEIKVGTVITYELKQGKTITLITHRVTALRVDSSGKTVYVTKGDNAGGYDAYRPSFDDVVGIYTGRSCGFFGYFFGFLQSSAGTIALIIIILIISLTLIVVHYVNLVSVWRRVAVDALRASGSILSDTKIEELGTIADVLAIVAKDPLDKTDIARKDKKLNWFIRTGTLPKRPYKDDMDDTKAADTGAVKIPKLIYASDEEDMTKANAEAYSEIHTERHEKVRYSYTVTAKLIQLKPKSKEWYSSIKNELLSYDRVSTRMGMRFERFMFKRKTIARLTVRGKTLCLLIDAEPAKYDNTKYHVEAVNSSTPCMYRIKSAKRAKYACELIAELMLVAGSEKNADYVQQDFYMPYEGIVSLLQKGLVKRNISSSEKTYQITEIEEGEQDLSDDE